MSAFVVKHKTIQQLIGYAAKHVFPEGLDVKELDRICTLLLNENIRSVNYRYHEETPTEELKYNSKYSYSEIISDATAVKTVNYYQYQACEIPNWEESEVKLITDKIKGIALDSFLDNCKEYHDAPDPWEREVTTQQT